MSGIKVKTCMTILINMKYINKIEPGIKYKLTFGEAIYDCFGIQN